MGRLGLLVGLMLGVVVMWASPAHAVDDQNCSDFTSQAAAQQHLREDPSDPDGLDDDNDGIACEDNPAPRDETPVNRSGQAAATTTTAAPAATTTTTTGVAAATARPSAVATTGSEHAVPLTLLALCLVAVGLVLNEMGPIRRRPSRAATVAFHRLDDALDEALR